MTNMLIPAIIRVLEDQGEVSGTRVLARRINAEGNLSRVVRYARRLQECGEVIVDVSLGGRGNKTLYRINRNQPGIQRKVRR